MQEAKSTVHHSCPYSAYVASHTSASFGSQTRMIFKYTQMVHAICSMVKIQYTGLIILALLYTHHFSPRYVRWCLQLQGKWMAIVPHLASHFHVLTERPNSVLIDINGDASLTEKPRNRSSWYLPFKLQSSVCFPNVARPNRSRILPLSHHYPGCNTHNQIVRKKAPIKKTILPFFLLKSAFLNTIY